MFLKIHPRAADEAEAAALTRGRRFLEAFVVALATVDAFPQSAPIWAGVEHLEIRKRVLPGTAFTMAYVLRGENVVILAIAHAKRRPFYWLARLHDE